jgi:energy-coupling factor transporter ATP-binding protein EcfA2
VGKSILDDCLLAGPLADRTRILVTHALRVLDKTDYIYVMDDGVVIEQGTYEVSIPFSVIQISMFLIWQKGFDGEQRRFRTSHGRTWKLGN